MANKEKKIYRIHFKWTNNQNDTSGKTGAEMRDINSMATLAARKAAFDDLNRQGLGKEIYSFITYAEEGYMKVECSRRAAEAFRKVASVSSVVDMEIKKVARKKAKKRMEAANRNVALREAQLAHAA